MTSDGLKIGITFIAAFSACFGTGSAAASTDFVPGEVIVRFAPDTSAGEKSSVRERAGVEFSDSVLLPRTQVVETDPGQSVLEAIDGLESSPEVLYAEPNYIQTLDAAPPSDPSFGLQWGLDNTGQSVNATSGTSGADIDALNGWDLGKSSPDVVTAVIDTGVALDQPDLSAQIWHNPGEIPNNIDDDENGLADDLNGWDFIAGDEDPTDGDGHGTHVSGIIGATGDNGIGVSGVSQDAKLMPLRACGAGGGCSVSAIIDAIGYAGAMGARVVNMSFGGSTFSQAQRDAIANAPETLFVASAGNEGNDAPNFGNNETIPKYPCQADQVASQPALANLICVASSNQFDLKAPSSNFGASSVDLAAPGTNIISTFPTFQYFFQNSFDAGGSTWDFVALDAGGVVIPNRWERNTGIGHEDVPSRAVTDSFGVNYSPGTNAIMTMTGAGMNLTGRSGCRVDYFLKLDTEQPTPGSFTGADLFYLEAAADQSGPWTRLVTAAGSPSGGDYPQAQEIGLGGSLHDFDGESSVYLRFGLQADGDANVGQGATVDDVNISCDRSSTGSPRFIYSGGTSMAAPQVSGIASIVRQLNPGLSAPAVKAKVLGGVDPLPVFAPVGPSPLVTGGRANLDRTLSSLDLTPPPAPSLVNPIAAGRVGSPPTFKWDHPDPSALFRLFLDGELVASGIGLNQFKYAGSLEVGGHNWMVTAADAPGNVAQSETRNFRYAPPGKLKVLSVKPFSMGGSKVRVRVSGAGRVKVSATAKSGNREKVVAKASVKARLNGETTVIARPTKAGRKLLAKKSRVKARFRITFVPASGGKSATAFRSAKLAR
ncbi:MAG: S8 family serine peptidase [Solirubrobacterales bacterium]